MARTFSDVSNTSIGAQLSGTAGIPTFPAAAAAANNVSIAEVLRYIEDALVGTNGVVTFPAAAAAANGVSLAEVLRYVSETQLPRIATKQVTFTAAGFEINTAVAVFTVTGNVMVRAFGVVATAIEADTGNDGTISLGVEDNVAILAPVVTVNETNFAASDVWGTATTTKEADVILNTGNFVVIGGGEDIEINVLVEDITAGVIDLYCQYIPLSSGASVVAV